MLVSEDPLMPFDRIGVELVGKADEQNEDKRDDIARPKQEVPTLEEVVIDEKLSEETKKTRANLSEFVTITCKHVDYCGF